MRSASRIKGLAAAATHPVWHDTLTNASLANAGSMPVAQHEHHRAPSQAQIDIAIIGGGFSGLWTAYYLSQLAPQLRIAVLEARTIGFGASGRNGGWCSGFLPLLPADLAQHYGTTQALATYRASFAILDEIKAVTQQQNIACDFHRGGTVQSATTPLQARRLAAVVEAQHAVGLTTADMAWIAPAQVADHLRVSETYGAIYSPHCATVNPYALCLGLARVLGDRGVALWENSPVHAFDNGVVTHQFGRVTANLVVQATEGYSHSLRQTKRRVVPLYSLMVATERLDTSTIASLGWKNRATFNDGSEMIIYAQLTADDRIAFGGRGAPYHFGSRVRESFDLDYGTHERIVDSIAQHFPAAGNTRITHRWGGPLAVPRDWTPSITYDRAAKYARLGGYVGDGVAATNLFARTLVDLVLERDTELTELPFVGHSSPRWEHEPFRYLGINSLIALSNSIDQHEARHGREPRLRRGLFAALL